jgi:hypothetical protein
VRLAVNRYRDQVASALAAATIRGPDRYAWLGRASRPVPPAVAAELGAAGRRTYLVRALRDELYVSFYCTGRPVVARWGAAEPAASDPWLVAAMSEANTGRGGWDPGWRVQRVDGADVVIESDRLRARAPVDDCRSGSGGIQTGAAVSVRLPNALPQLSPGFYTIVGDNPARAPSATTVRVYWNVTPEGAPALVGALVSRLNADRVPFRLKVGDHPFRLDRCDAAVLYVSGDDFRALDETLQKVIRELRGALLRRVPTFTLEYAPGVALAEDDGDGESFGMRLCALLAEGMVRVHERQIGDAGPHLDMVAACFADAGVDIDAPYRAPSLAGRHVV